MIIAVLTLILMSFSIRMLLQILGQHWVCTVAHTSTLVALPLLTYIITSVISGNIALSLGMVGALSIVRFRNPVRSPLELSVYFCAITMGIAAAVDLKWLALLGGSIVAAAGFLVFVNQFSKRILKRDFFITSFSEGNSLTTLEIMATSEIESLEQNQFLNGKHVLNNKIEYILCAANFNDLKLVARALKDNVQIVEVRLNK